MSKYYYKLPFYPHGSYMKAKNYIDAWDKFQRMFPEYNVKKIAELHRC